MSQKKKFILIAVVLAVLVVVGVAALMAMNGRKDNQTVNNSGTSNSDTSPQQDALLGPTFTDSQTGVTVRAPKDWELAPKDTENPNSLTKFQHKNSRANGELAAVRSNASMDDIIRGYLEGAINVDYKTSLIDNKTVTIGNKPARLLIQDIPGPDGQTARLTQYFFNKDGTYYILTYTILGSDWEAQRPGIEASAASLKMK